MNRLVLAAVLSCAALSAAAAPPAAPAKPAAPRASTSEVNLWLEFRIQHAGKSYAHRILSREATQSNTVVHDAEGVSMIFNALPVLEPGHPQACVLQFQLEVSRAKNVTVQVKNEVRIRLGKETVVVDDPDLRVSVEIIEQEL
ncbi:MAG: hypothetical protein WC969_01820 [Elusimicrobiota bacterium]|jgi:hypothetical protein